jgi:transcriptional regulator with XRE-family HTH domain
MKKNSRLEERRLKIPVETRLFIKHSFEIVDRIFEIMEKKKVSQKELAKLLGKSESEISKWMTGTHNFTLKTLSKIEDILGEPIINTTKEKQDDILNEISITDQRLMFKASNQRAFYLENMDATINMHYCKSSSLLN